jgi:small-conductance mechanosensitive channel
MSNVISGMFLLGEGTVAIGDKIKVGNTVGEVISID